MSVAYEAPRVEDQPSVVAPVSSPPPPMPPRPPRRSRRAWLAAVGLSAVVVLGVAAESVPPNSPGHPLLVNIVAGGSVPATPPSVGPVQADPQVAAIQQVIQRANAEQTQAIATQNPAVM